VGKIDTDNFALRQPLEQFACKTARSASGIHYALIAAEVDTLKHL
jgi:hypothetical protein